MEPHVVIDCYKFIKGTGKSAGIPNVAKRIIRALKETYPDMNLTVIGNKFNHDEFDICGVNFVEIEKDPHSKKNLLMWEMFTVNKVLKKLKADVVLYPRGFSALAHPIKDVVLIHDMIPFYYMEKFPDYFNPIENAYMMTRLKQSAKSAKAIITISEASKADIVKYTKCDPNKIHVILNGSNKLEYKGTSGGGRYLCSMATDMPHKNAKGIVDSYAEYRKIASDPLPLHIIGIKDLSKIEVDEEVAQHIICHDFIASADELHSLIAHSEVFFFLSLVEGFGLPPVEAMTLGVPVVCSNRSSLPEACGEAAYYVDPENPVEVAEALEKVQNEKELRKHLVKLGRNQEKALSWESRAKLYHDVLIGE